MIPERDDPHDLPPDVDLCAAKDTGAGDLVDCLAAHPCRWALPFGHGRFCRHPRSGEIVTLTATRKGDPERSGS